MRRDTRSVLWKRVAFAHTSGGHTQAQNPRAHGLGIAREIDMQLIGLLAGGCVLATFCMQSMVALRAFAIASNVLFIVYGASADLLPIVLLHVILLPINGWSLGTIVGGRPAAITLSIFTACAACVLTATMLHEGFASAGPQTVNVMRRLFSP
jgi:hypothetical protein